MEITPTDKRASNRSESSSLRRTCSRTLKKKGKLSENRSFLIWKGPAKMLINGKGSNEMKRTNWLKPKRDCKSMNKSNLCARKTPQRRKRMTTRISNIRRMIVGSGLVQLRTREARREKGRVFCLSAETTTISTRMIRICKRKPSRRVTLTRSTMK